MKIKFCGIRRLEDVAAVNLCQPDYMGMILSGGFRRSISQEQAQRLVQEKSDAIAAVGVFVNESSEIICRMAEQLHLQVIQLHGNESAEQIQTLQQKTGLPVWKALRIGTLEELEAAGTNPADCLILEGKTGAGIGGTGVCADWEPACPTQLESFVFFGRWVATGKCFGGNCNGFSHGRGLFQRH